MDSIREYLLDKGYSEYEADKTIIKIENMDKQIKKEFDNWFATGELPDLEIEGIDFLGVLNNINDNEIAVFLYMDWLKREPQAAKRAFLRPIDNLIKDN